MSIRPHSYAGGRAARDALRQKLFNEQGGLCHLCAGPMLLHRKEGTNGKVHRLFATFDHVIPKASGGTTYYTNLKLAHRNCNSARGTKPPPASPVMPYSALPTGEKHGD